MDDQDPRIQDGLDIISLMWQETAFKIIELAIQVYNLNKEQADAIKDIYYRPNDYIAELCD